MTPDMALTIDRVETVLASHRQPLRVAEATGGRGPVTLRMTGRVAWSEQLLLDLAVATGAREWQAGVCDGCTVLSLS